MEALATDPQGWADRLGISRAAIDLYLDSDVIDQHVDSFIWKRVWGYDLQARHGRGLLNARVYSSVDVPRALEAHLTGAIWVITTNPLRSARGRRDAFFHNLEQLTSVLERDDNVRVVRNVAEYRAARGAGQHGAFIGIQGGNALDFSLDDFDRLPDGVLLRVTLVHLSSSKIGVTSTPLRAGGQTGLSDFGRDYVRRLNEKKIFVDLAHISRDGFFDALEVHDRTQPAIVTHTGVCGVHDHWRNLTDDQLRAIADLGGCVGVMFHSNFLGDRFWGGQASRIVDHLEHVVKTVGEDYAGIGSDFDGAIIPPRDVATVTELPRLVELMLQRGMSEVCVRKILGGNFLRVVEALRG